MQARAESRLDATTQRGVVGMWEELVSDGALPKKVSVPCCANPENLTPGEASAFGSGRSARIADSSGVRFSRNHAVALISAAADEVRSDRLA